jgi:hypothetical protein
VASPVEQFKLKSLVPFELGGVDLSYTTSSLWMTITVVGVTAFFNVEHARRKVGARAVAINGGNVLRIHSKYDTRKRWCGRP